MYFVDVILVSFIYIASKFKIYCKINILCINCRSHKNTKTPTKIKRVYLSYNFNKIIIDMFCFQRIICI